MGHRIGVWQCPGYSGPLSTIPQLSLHGIHSLHTFLPAIMFTNHPWFRYLWVNSTGMLIQVGTPPVAAHPWWMTIQSNPRIYHITEWLLLARFSLAELSFHIIHLVSQCVVIWIKDMGTSFFTCLASQVLILTVFTVWVGGFLPRNPSPCFWHFPLHSVLVSGVPPSSSYLLTWVGAFIGVSHHVHLLSFFLSFSSFIGRVRGFPSEYPSHLVFCVCCYSSSLPSILLAWLLIQYLFICPSGSVVITLLSFCTFSRLHTVSIFGSWDD